jgi:hypothetical protein
MKNQKLRDLIAKRGPLAGDPPSDRVEFLNNEDMILMMGGSQLTECPKLTACTTFSDCNGKCTVKV